MNVQKGLLLPTIGELKECSLIATSRIRQPIVGATPEEARRLWLQARRKTIGASDIPAITGTSKYMGAYRLWHEKKGNIELDESESVRQRAGHAMEPLLAKGIATDHPGIGRIVNPNGIGICHPLEQYKWNVASPDRILILDGAADIVNNPLWIPIELKNVSAWAARDWDEASVPEMYYEQVQDQLEVTGRPCAILAACIDGNPFKNIWTVWRDYRRIERIMPAAEYFWNSLENDTPPLPSDLESDKKCIRKLYPNAVELPNDGKAPLGAQAIEWAREYLKAGKDLKRLETIWNRIEKAKNAAANNLSEYMKEIARATGGGVNVSWLNQEAWQVDEEARSNDPEIARLSLELEMAKAKYKQRVTTRVLRITEPKSAKKG